ncbi:MAG: septum formation inhibitor Maf [Ilumatobacter coccineus]|uniref:dTTP/UTP pyrophosphatase n=1 Tax=Ilumatobacter coccineus TaxID=467094 RepID=A0A2G6K8J0_9ACTN|nr:MAG: septum formation inhibitor Maf [Ilumatobacter coccineus]
MRLVLASGSPRRQEVLARCGVAFDIHVADVDETPRPGEEPASYTDRVARAKAAAVAAIIEDPDEAVVLAADTTVALGGQIMGKPVDDDDARRMLTLLSDRAHQVHTTVVGRRGSDVHAVTVTTEVTFVRLSPNGIDWYLSLGDHLDKAGAYGMQSAGAVLVHRIDGSPSNVVGLPLAETVGVLRSCGYAVV